MLEALVARYKSRPDPRLAERIVAEVEPFLCLRAKRYASVLRPMEDLVQEGRIAVYRALERFEPQQGVKFLTCAGLYAERAMQHYCRDCSGLIAEPGYLQEARLQVERLVESLQQQMGRRVTDAELRREASIDPNLLERVLETEEIFQVASMTSVVREKNGSATERQDDFAGPDSAIERVQNRLLLEQAAHGLTARSRTILRLMYGCGFTYMQIGARMGLSPQRVEQLHQQSLAQIRAACHGIR